MSDRIGELENLIRRYRESYYNGEGEITDAEYDALEDELRVLDPDNEVLSEIGSTSTSGWPKVEHRIPMSSLNKANSLEDVLTWRRNALRSAGKTLLPEQLDLCVVEKMDGISIALYYEGGKLVNAVTRGDGSVGEDIIANVVLMRGVPRYLREPLNVAFRGEIVLHKAQHRNHFPDYANPRNAASGLSRREAREEAAACEHLDVYVYAAYPSTSGFDTLEEELLWVKTLGFKTPSYYRITSTQDLHDLYRAYEEVERDLLPYEIDGLVVNFNQTSVRSAAGLRNRRPHGSVAFKFEAATALTRLTDVTWQVGKTGRLTPVAHFNTVKLVGANISKASLYNAQYIKDLDLKVGDEILVSRANDVIPKVIRVVRSNDSFTRVSVPEECPVCSSEVDKDGEYLVCSSSVCPSKVSGRLSAWIESLGILDWGEGLLDTLVSEGLVSDIPDLYTLKAEDLCDLQNAGGARLGEKTARRLLQSLHGVKSLPLDRFLGGLNIPMTRSSTVRKVMTGGYDTLDSIRQASLSEIEEIRGLGAVKALALEKGLRDNEATIKRLLEYVSIESASGTLSGLAFCITGKLSRPRKQIEADIREAGGDIKGSVTSSLDYLVVNDPESTSSKAKKARNLGVPMISEDRLAMMIRGNSPSP